MCVNKDAARDSSQVLFELSKFKICYDQDKNCHLISQEATQKNLIKMHKRTNSEDKNDIHILYLYWLKPLLNSYELVHERHSSQLMEYLYLVDVRQQ